MRTNEQIKEQKKKSIQMKQTTKSKWTTQRKNEYYLGAVEEMLPNSVL